MARKKTADLDESLEGSDELEDAEEREEDDDGDEQVAEEAAEPPRRRRVSEILEGSHVIEYFVRICSAKCRDVLKRGDADIRRRENLIHFIFGKRSTECHIVEAVFLDEAL